VAVSGRLEKLYPSVALEFLLELDSLVDFLVLNFDEFRVLIATSMSPGKNLLGFLILSLGN
jgi:hypothetical protein